MKKVLVIAGLILLMSALAFGQSIHYGKTTTIAWDTVTVTSGTISYEVYLRNGAQTVLGETTSTQYVVTLNDFVLHDVGVRAVWTDAGIKYYSDIAWSDVEGKPVPFALQQEHPAPAKPANLHWL